VAAAGAAGRVRAMNRSALTAMLRRHEAREVDDADVTRTWIEVSQGVLGFTALDETHQHVLLDMAFTLGLHGLKQFTKMLAALERRDFDTAATEMLVSTWARKVGDRATELAAMMRQPMKGV
jgi:GH24 family phage-related lysozyme (muramidase)